MIANISFLFYDCNFEILEACNTPLEKYFQDLFSCILKASKFLNHQLVNPKNKIVFIWQVQIKVVKRTAMDKQLQLSFTMFSTSEGGAIFPYALGR